MNSDNMYKYSIIPFNETGVVSVDRLPTSRFLSVWEKLFTKVTMAHPNENFPLSNWSIGFW